MKTVLVVIIASILLISSVFQIQPIVKANPFTNNKVPTFRIVSPTSWQYSCYQNASIPIIVEIKVLETSNPQVYNPQIDNISYILDSKENITLSNFSLIERFPVYSGKSGVSLRVNATLHNLTEGNHTLRAYSFDTDGKVMSDELTFTVDSSYKNPELTLISPKNTTYTTNQVQIIFSTNKEYKNASYYLDYDLGGHTININGNTTISNLTEGTHKIMVFADCFDKYHRYGIATTQGTSFAVNTTKTENTIVLDNETNIAILASAIAIVAVASTSLVWFKKKKNLASKQSF